MKRHYGQIGLLSGLLLFLVGYAETANTDANLPVIAIKASRFHYQPDKITLKKGQTVLLEIAATDHAHGFAVPELGLRVDAPQGQAVRVKLMPSKIGSFSFHCDIFCGTGHEDMAVTKNETRPLSHHRYFGQPYSWFGLAGYFDVSLAGWRVCYRCLV